MSVLGALFEKRATKKITNPQNPAYWLQKLFGAQDTYAKIDVSEDSSLRFSPIWAAVNIISGAVGYLPLHLYARNADRSVKNRAYDDERYALLHDRANPYMDAMTFRQTLQAHALTWGNGYAEIQRDGAGRPVALWPIMPDRVDVKVINEEVVYEVRDNSGGILKRLDDQSMLHVKGLGFDGLRGYSVIHYAAESIATGLAIERFGASFFGNRAMPGGALKHPGQIGEKAQENLKKSLEDQYSGANAHKTMILEEGMEWQQIGIPPEDAQFLQSSKFRIAEVGRWFNIPLHMLNELDRATFSNIEHLAIEFVTLTLMPWLKRWEHEVNRKLLAEREQNILFAEFDPNALLRGTTEARYRAYAIGRQWGWLSVNKILEKENENPIENGDVYLQPLNMGPAGEPRLPQPASPRERDLALSHVSLLADAIRRMRTKEINAVRRAATKGPEQFGQWLVPWYAEHRQTFASAIEPAIHSWNRLSCAQLDANAIANQHSAQAAEALADAARGADGQLVERIDAILRRWENDSTELAMGIIQRSAEYAVSQ